MLDCVQLLSCCMKEPILCDGLLCKGNDCKGVLMVDMDQWSICFSGFVASNHWKQMGLLFFSTLIVLVI